MIRRTLVLLMTTFICIPVIAGKRVTTTIIPHSLAVNAARELAGWENKINCLETDRMHGVCAVIPQATLSFRPERIAQCFFGDAILKCDNTIHVVASQHSRVDADWLADYFGLPTDYESNVYVRPQVAQGLVDLALQIELHALTPGLYLRMHAPIVYSNWDLHLCETLISTGTNSHAPGYFNADGIARADLLENFTSFISGSDAPTSSGITFQKLEHAKMDCHNHDLVKVSDIQIALGYNIIQKKRYHCGVNLRLSIPTGNRPTGEFLFEPIIGNGHHWELGAGLSTHCVVWNNEETQEQAGIYFDMNLTHLFKTCQKRSFDLCSSHNSRYMLAQKMIPDIQNNLRGTVQGERITPLAQYDTVVTSVANLTTLAIQVSAAIQTDLAVMISYQKKKNSWGFGYGFWAKSCESIQLCGTTPFQKESWALKGDAHLFGFADDGLDTPIALSATQSDATIHRGKNFSQTGATTPLLVAQGAQNPHIDVPAGAVADPNGDSTFESVRTLPGGTDQINTSIQPVLLTHDAIDIDSARTRGAAHKIFSHFSHTITLENTTPYIGFGAEVEFGQGPSPKRLITVGSPTCVNSALSFWAVWLKGGIAF